MIRDYLVVLGYIVLLALVLGAVLSVVMWIIARCFPTGEDERPRPPMTVRGATGTRDITIGKDQHVGERLDALRKLQKGRS